MIVKRKSVISGTVRQRDIPVDPNDMMLYKLGMGNIQDLMPYLSVADREFIMAGITEDEWNRAFAECEG